MTIYAPPAKTEISDTYPNPSDAVARAGFGKLWDYITSLLGVTGNPSDARTALGAAKSGANTDITSLGTVTGIGNGSSTHVVINSGGAVGIGGTPDGSALLDVQSTTKGIKLPSMTTTQKNAITNSAGVMVFDATLGKMNINTGSGWASAGGGATGGGSDDAFYENTNTITSNYTITTGKNAMSAGPITINTGVTVTIPTGSTWSII
jgi:hypothetical protein